jgi:hypothetical protein
VTVPVDRVDQPWEPITPTPRSRLASRAWNRHRSMAEQPPVTVTVSGRDVSGVVTALTIDRQLDRAARKAPDDAPRSNLVATIAGETMAIDDIAVARWARRTAPANPAAAGARHAGEPQRAPRCRPPARGALATGSACRRHRPARAG